MDTKSENNLDATSVITPKGLETMGTFSAGFDVEVNAGQKTGKVTTRLRKNKHSKANL